MDDTSTLTQLGSNETRYQYDSPCSGMLETFPSQFPGYWVHLKFPEFTSLCPKTGQPDFGKISINYIPRNKCIETKSLKLYLFSWRNQGTFMETIVNTIRDHLVQACDPQWMEVKGEFNPRGGIEIIVSATHGKDF